MEKSSLVSQDIDMLQSNIDALQHTLLDSEVFSKLDGTDIIPIEELLKIDAQDQQNNNPHQGATLKEISEEDLSHHLQHPGSRNASAAAAASSTSANPSHSKNTPNIIPSIINIPNSTNPPAPQHSNHNQPSPQMDFNENMIAPADFYNPYY